MPNAIATAVSSLPAHNGAPARQHSPAGTSLMAYASRLDRELDALKQFFAHATAETRGLAILSVLDIRFDFDLPYNVCERIFNDLHGEACRALSGTNIPLELDTNDVYEQFFAPTDGYGRYKPREGFTAVRVMEAMLEAWEPKAREIEDAQIAQWFYNEFVGRRYAEPPRIVGARTVLTQSAYTDDRFSGKDYSYSTRESIRKAVNRFSIMLDRLDPDSFIGTAEATAASCIRHFEMNQWKPSREFRAHLGPIEIRTFQKKVEYYLPQAFAEALNLFVSSHADTSDAR